MLAALIVHTQSDIEALARMVDPNRLKATVERLAQWHDRNTNNQTLFEAADWLADQFKQIPGLQVETWHYPIKKGRRVIADKDVVEVIATLPGQDDERVMVGGHFDTINMTVRDLAESLKLRSPGANDDASAVALTLEAARVLATRKWKHTLNFICFSGEEQGLLGSTALAKRAKAESWKIDAFINNDNVGNSHDLAGHVETKRVRVFSEESDKHQGRELARFIADAGKSKDFGVKLVLRRDRFGRSGDHVPFNEEGFTAARVVDVNEEYTRQHTVDDLPAAMDFPYLANVTRLDLRAMALLADAGDPPERVIVDRRQGHDTRVTWRGKAGTKYRVYWRETTSAYWEGHKDVGEATEATIVDVNKDDHIFAVGAVGGIPVEAK